MAFAAMISKRGFLLAVLLGLSVFADQELTDLMENELLNHEGASGWIWVYGTFSFLIGVIAPPLLGILAISAWRLQHISIAQVFKLHLAPLIKEALRTFGQSLAWGFLFILPGIFRFFQCLFVPFVVLLDPEYQAGNVDALAGSWRRVKLVWPRLLAVFFFFGVAWPLLMTSFDRYKSISETPITATLLFFIELTVTIVFQWSVLQTWERAYELNLSKN